MSSLNLEIEELLQKQEDALQQLLVIEMVVKNVELDFHLELEKLYQVILEP